MTDSEEIICVMCEQPSDYLVNLQGSKLMNAILCWSCSNKLQNLIEHCDLDWSFTLGITQAQQTKRRKSIS